MKQSKKTAAIIAAAGLGKRMGSGIPKQYMKIGGEPILLKTLKAFEQNGNIDEICVVTNGDYIPYCRELKERHGLNKLTMIAEGGKERQDSVSRALQTIQRQMPDAGWVLIHDGARPFISQKVIDDVAAAAKAKGAAAACVPVKDSIRQRTDRGSRNLPRENLFAVQTPQGFEMDLLIRAYEKAFDDGFYGTDDAGLAERLGCNVEIVMGDYSNFKVTTREDLPMEQRTGSGYDVHRLVKDRKLILGGEEIPFEKGLLGHSDADVLTHAVMDALLGAASMGDIGRHFPDTDQRYKGASSMKLLAEVRDKLSGEGYRVGNIDATVIAQRPKIKSFIGDMEKNIARVLEIETDRVNIKGTTTEKLGFEGREEGIAAQAVCLIYR